MKFCYKRPSFDFYDTVAMECWLSDMAKRGLLYSGNNFAFFRFLKAEPQNIYYRVEPTTNDEIELSAEILSAYNDAGWEFVAHQGNQFFIWKSIRPNATELHTDPIVQSESYLSQAVQKINTLCSLHRTLRYYHLCNDTLRISCF